jgi:hypothetical protein
LGLRESWRLTGRGVNTFDAIEYYHFYFVSFALFVVPDHPASNHAANRKYGAPRAKAFVN